MKAYIYCIYNNKFKKDFYIGSTKDFKKRMDCHKSDCYNTNSRGYNYTLYKFIRDNGGWSEWSKMIIATVDVADKLEKRKIEQVYIDHLQPCLNDYRSYQTAEQRKECDKQYHKEYYNRNKEQLIERQNEYTNKNKEQIKEWKNKIMICICGSKYTNANKARHERTNKHKNYILSNQTNLINI